MRSCSPCANTVIPSIGPAFAAAAPAAAVAWRHKETTLVEQRIPILKMGEFLLVTIQVDMHDRLAMTLQDDLTNRVSQTGAKGVLIDISALDIVDSFIGRMLAN